jgi:hypothetical protein
MTRGPITFKGTDLKRALAAAKEVGLEIRFFEIAKSGSILVHVGEADDTVSDDLQWDKALNQ